MVRQRRPAPSTTASRSSPTRPSRRSCPRASAPTSTWSPTSRTTRSWPRAIEVRGLKVTVSKVPVPVAYGPAFEGERVRKDDMYVELGGGQDAGRRARRIRRHGRGRGRQDRGRRARRSTTCSRGASFRLAIGVEVAGRQMQEDFEPILERQIHHLINYAQGILHMGQRDIVWLRVSKKAVDKGFTHRAPRQHPPRQAARGLRQDRRQGPGHHLHRRERRSREILEKARALYRQRDERIAGMTDEDTDPFYSCTALPVLRAEPRLRRHAGADGPLRRLQLARLQGRLRDQPHGPEPAGAQGRGARRAIRPVEGRQRVRGQGLAGHGPRPWTPTASCATP